MAAGDGPAGRNGGNTPHMNRFLGGRFGRPLTLVVALLSLTLALGTPVSANAAVRTPSHVVAKNATGTMKSYVTGTASRGRTVVGSFTPSKFVEKNGQLRAIGKLNVVTRGPGKDLHRVKYGVSMLVKRGSVAQHRQPSARRASPGRGRPRLVRRAQPGARPAGPQPARPRGAPEQVVLDIVAVTGAGNLLGNLLCAVAGLLDGSACSARWPTCSTRSWPPSGSDTSDS